MAALTDAEQQDDWAENNETWFGRMDNALKEWLKDGREELARLLFIGRFKSFEAIAEVYTDANKFIARFNSSISLDGTIGDLFVILRTLPSQSAAQEQAYFEVRSLPASKPNTARLKHFAETLDVKIMAKGSIGDLPKNNGAYNTDTYNKWKWNGKSEKQAAGDVLSALSSFLENTDGVVVCDTNANIKNNNQMKVNWKNDLFTLGDAEMQTLNAQGVGTAVPDYCFFKCEEKEDNVQNLGSNLVVAMNVKCENHFNASDPQGLNELIYLSLVAKKFGNPNPPIVFHFSMGFHNPTAYYFIRNDNSTELCTSELSDKLMIDWCMYLCGINTSALDVPVIVAPIE